MHCVECKTYFIEKRCNNRFCSSVCSERFHSRRKRAEKADYHRRKAREHYQKYGKSCSINTCLQCNCLFKPTGKQSQQFCSIKCAAKSRVKRIVINLDVDLPDRHVDRNIGYVRIYVPNHPRANTWGYVYEHVILMEDYLHRSLTDNEVVHHKNGIRSDNRLENLQVMTKEEHSKLKK